MIFYGLVLLSISVVIGVLWRYVASHRDLLEPDVTDDDVSAMTAADDAQHGLLRRSWCCLAILAPEVAAFGFLSDRPDRRLSPARRQDSFFGTRPMTGGSALATLASGGALLSIQSGAFPLGGRRASPSNADFATNSRQSFGPVRCLQIEKPRLHRALVRYRYRDSNPGFRRERPAS